jgi:hypothetical protein
MRYVLTLALFVATTACTTVPSAPDPLAFKGDAACPAQFDAAKDEVQWRKNVVDYGRIGGVILAASGPAVAIGGIVLDEQPATPPVETFVAGAGLSAAGVLAIVLTGSVIPDLEAQAAVARHAYATPCPG